MMDNNSNKKEENRKVRRNVIIFFIILFLIIAILIGLLLWLHFSNIKEERKAKYQVNYDISLLTDTSSLDNKSFTLSVTTNDNKYVTYLVLSTIDSNASIGSYIEQDYLYSIYDRNPNKLDISLNVKDKTSNNYVDIKKISDVTFDMQLGDKSNHNLYTLTNNGNTEATYTSPNDIYIYSVQVSFSLVI